MTTGKQKLLERLVERLPQLKAGQLHWIDRVATVFSSPYSVRRLNDTLLDLSVIDSFGDAMRVHHSFSMEPFSKDKFEFVLVEVLKLNGYEAVLAPKGNPGHDITIADTKLSLKTQANTGIKESTLWISKFMELGKGAWGDDPSDLHGLRSQFLTHLTHYDRILVLRAIQKTPSWKYELVEIPKTLLQKATGGSLVMLESKQFPKPGHCPVTDEHNNLLYTLYFDGGTERKLQIKNLRKDQCIIHATWDFVIP